jgi:hypothetical protein
LGRAKITTNGWHAGIFTKEANPQGKCKIIDNGAEIATYLKPVYGQAFGIRPSIQTIYGQALIT